MININEIVLKLPGINEEEARILAKEVSHKLAGRLPEGLKTLTIDQIRIRLDDPKGLSRTQLADRIATAIWKDIGGRVI